MATYNFNAELYDNPLTEKEGDFTARPIVNKTFYNKDIAARITEKRTEYRLETIINILDLADQEKGKAIAEGQSVVDGVGQYLVNIRGVFESETDKFDPKRHNLGISYNPGKLVRSLLADTAVNVTKAATTGPIIGMVTDSKSDTVNERLTPGQPIKIAGSNLKIMGDPDKAGVFFVSTNNATTKKSELIVTNNPSELILTVPELSSGWYRIRVVTNYASGGKQTKEPRTNEYPISLVVGDGIEEV